jgi:ERCC4-type nuclease
MAQLSDDVTVFQPESESATLSAMTSFTAALSVVKKGNKTAEGTAQAMLSAIPGLGAKRIAALLETRSVAELVQMDTATLAAVVAGGKKLGAKLAETMVAAFGAKPAS